jgi:HD-GYP domain-containing protein (c-di-GMP phosphodiesterase class II)
MTYVNAIRNNGRIDERTRLPLADIMSALSHALDLVEGQPPGHCIRCCWIGIQVGQKLNLDAEALTDLYYAIMLKDLGCSSNAARICSHYLTDDILFKRNAKTMDGSLPQVLRFVLNHTGLQSDMSQRFRAVLTALKTGPEMARELVETRCTRGANIALQMRFSQRVADAIHSLDEHWDGSGQPERRKAETIPQFSQIALLAQVVDVFHTEGGEQSAHQEVNARSATWFDPLIVAAFNKLSAGKEFWADLASTDLETKVLALEPAQANRYVDEDYLDDIAQAFAQVVDAKSPFTAGHSNRVTAYTDMIAGQLGYSSQKRRWLRRAALLHDIGKLGISNSVLDKPDKLTDEEFTVIKVHPVYSGNILGRVQAFEDIAPIARGHHERLDGNGYPDRLEDQQICLDTRIVTVADIFDALTADRPYRAAMPQTKAFSIMDEMVGNAIDADCYAALKAALANQVADVA